MRVRDVGVSHRYSWRRVPLVLLLVKVVDVMVLLTLMGPPGVVAGDAPGDADAAGVAGVAPVYGVAGAADDGGVVGRWCAVLRCRWRR